MEAWWNSLLQPTQGFLGFLWFAGSFVAFLIVYNRDLESWGSISGTAYNLFWWVASLYLVGLALLFVGLVVAFVYISVTDLAGSLLRLVGL